MEEEDHQDDQKRKANASDRGSSRKRTRSEKKKKQHQTDSDSGSDDNPIISNGIVDIPISSIHNRLICGLCSGYFKDPYTITECLHTFCKSCLFYAVACGCHECPNCKVYLGNDPLRVAVLDHALQELVDRIVFPDIVKEEEEREREFYAARGIALKPEFALKTKKTKVTASSRSASPQKKDRAAVATKVEDEMEFTLMPEILSKSGGLPPLERPCLRISAKFRMNQLKKYLFQKLDISPVDQPSLDILCNGVPLGDEISLSFVKRLLWPYESDLALTYRVAEDGQLTAEEAFE